MDNAMTMLLKRISALTLTTILVACAGTQPSYRLTRLPSGKEIKVLAVGQIHFSEGGAALMLKYETDLRLDDKAALQNEIDEIWTSFRNDVEKAQLQSAIVSANEPRKGEFISTNRGVNFVFKKAADGSWQQQ